MSVADTRGRAKSCLGNVRVQDKEGSNRRLFLIVRHIHHILVEESREMREEAGMEVQHHLISLGSYRGGHSLLKQRRFLLPSRRSRPGGRGPMTRSNIIIVLLLLLQVDSIPGVTGMRRSLKRQKEQSIQEIIPVTKYTSKKIKHLLPTGI